MVANLIFKPAYLYKINKPQNTPHYQTIPFVKKTKHNLQIQNTTKTQP